MPTRFGARLSQLASWGELRNTYVVKNIEPDRTRDQVARTILEHGPATAVDLALKLAITTAGIRRHLDSLIAEGVLTAREAHQSSANLRGRGRPAKVFVMTDIGREKFEHSYDDLAVSALKYMASKAGANLVEDFARSRAVDIERRAGLVIDSTQSLPERAQSLATFLSEERTLQRKWRGNLSESLPDCPRSLRVSRIVRSRNRSTFAVNGNACTTFGDDRSRRWRLYDLHPTAK